MFPELIKFINITMFATGHCDWARFMEVSACNDILGVPHDIDDSCTLFEYEG